MLRSANGAGITQPSLWRSRERNSNASASLGEWENPYLTMNFDYQATIVREFGKFLLNGSVYKGKKPVHWCPTCRTALAEAEVKYEDHRSPSIYVKFKMVSDIGDLSSQR